MAPSLAPLFELRLLAMMLPCISELAQISMHWLLQGPRAVARPPANRAAPHLSHLVLAPSACWLLDCCACYSIAALGCMSSLLAPEFAHSMH